LTWAKGTYQSIRGPITSEWTIANGIFALDLDVPPNTSATVYLPTNNAPKIRESGEEVGASKGIRLIRSENKLAIFEVLSGSYHFRSPL
jgi:alpha-L-rhamnosidase